MKLRYFGTLRESVAASDFPGWRSQGTSVGTDTVVMPDPASAAKEWAGSLGRKPSKKDRAAWEMHASRTGLSPDQASKFWMNLVNEQRALFAEALRIIFSENSAEWAGVNYPLKQMIDPNKRSVRPEPSWDASTANDKQTATTRSVRSTKKKLPLPPPLPQEESGPPMIAFPKMHQAPQIGNTVGQAQAANEKSPGFPFSTKAAGIVWGIVQKMMLDHPEMPPPDILGQALQQAKTPIFDLTPEDIVLLQMAMQFFQNGPAKTNVRIGGTPNDASDATGP